MRVIMRVRRDAVDAKDRRSPGYRAAVESAAVGSDDTHYDVPREAYAEIVRQHAAVVVPVRRLRRVDVGGLVERMLTRVGITKERVQAWTRLKDCGCKARQRWLTQWGYRQQDKIERLLNKAARWYGLN